MFLVGDSAIGSPYCQSISLGFKHNTDLFERIDDPAALLQKLHIY